MKDSGFGESVRFRVGGLGLDLRIGGFDGEIGKDIEAAVELCLRGDALFYMNIKKLFRGSTCR